MPPLDMIRDALGILMDNVSEFYTHIPYIYRNIMMVSKQFKHYTERTRGFLLLCAAFHVEHGNLETLKTLHELTDIWLNDSLVYLAIEYNQDEITRFLLSHGCRNKSLIIKMLIRAAKIDLVKYFYQLHPGMDVNLLIDEYFSPLGIAAHMGYYNIIEYLIEERRADPVANGGLAIIIAIERDRYEIFRYFIEKCGVDIHFEGEKFLKRAVIFGRLGFIAYLIEKGADKSRVGEIEMRWAEVAGNHLGAIEAALNGELKIKN